MLYVSSIGAYVDQCEWLERATPHPSKRCAMLLSMSPRRSWRSMLTSFGCEQIVQVRAMQFDSKSALGLRSLKTYSGTGQPGATAKTAQYRGGNASGCRDAFVVALLQLRVLRLGLLQHADVRVGIFPEHKEVLIGALCFGCVAVHCVGSAELQRGNGL